MNNKINIRIKNRLTSSILIWTLILLSGSIINVVGFIEIQYIIGLIIILFISLRNKILFKKRVHLDSFKFLVFFSIIFLLHSLVENDIELFLSPNNFRFLIMFFISYLSVIYFRKKELTFILTLNKILFFILIHGLISWLVITLFPTTNQLLISEDEGSKFVGYAYIFFQRVNIDYFGNINPTTFSLFGVEFQRAHSLLWEPGNFATYINIFIFLNLFILKNTKYVILGIIGIVLSWSTTGFLVLIIILSLFAVINYKNQLFIIRSIILGVPVIFILLMFFSTNFQEKIEGKNAGSGAIRITNTIASIYTIAQTPFIGTGLDADVYYDKLTSNLGLAKSSVNDIVQTDLVNKTSSTNSFLRLFVQLGVPIGILFTYSFFKQNIIPKNKKIFAWLIILSTTAAPLLFTPFFFLFVVNGINQISLKK